jgi:hypothetical protein
MKYYIIGVGEYCHPSQCFKHECGAFYHKCGLCTLKPMEDAQFAVKVKSEKGKDYFVVKKLPGRGK